MIYLLHGTDSAKAREKLNNLVSTLLAKKPDATLVRINTEQLEENGIEEYIHVQGLFEERSIIVCDGLLSDTVYRDTVLKNASLLERSDNVFIFIEGELSAKVLQKISKHAEKVQEFTAKGAKTAKRDFNIFALSDALGERNRKKLWVIYQTGKMQNVVDEEMHGILFWGVKNMLLAGDANNAEQAGLSPFVYKKASMYAKNYSQNELRELSGALTKLYHEARRGKGAFDTEFERFILNLP